MEKLKKLREHLIKIPIYFRYIRRSLRNNNNISFSIGDTIINKYNPNNRVYITDCLILLRAIDLRTERFYLINDENTPYSKSVLISCKKILVEKVCFKQKGI